jgi:hypothetical protein
MAGTVDGASTTNTTIAAGGAGATVTITGSIDADIAGE